MILYVKRLLNCFWMLVFGRMRNIFIIFILYVILLGILELSSIFFVKYGELFFKIYVCKEWDLGMK